MAELTYRQRRAIASLLATRSIPEAAASAKVGERSIYRWLDDPQFKQALSAAQSEAIDTAARRLIGLQDQAIDTLAELGKSENESIRLQAAQAILDQVVRYEGYS